MKNRFQAKTFFALLVVAFFLVSTTSCVVAFKTNSGLKKGWNKNEHNPHHHNSKNPGKKKGKSNHKKNGYKIKF